MAQLVQLARNERVAARPFTSPSYIVDDQATLCYMAGQVCVLMEYPYLSAEPPHIVLFNRPDKSSWFHRIVLAEPDTLRQTQLLTIVGFFGRKRADADIKYAHEFDRILVAEIPQHPGLLSYSTMALENDNYANLVIFTAETARDHWSTSRAHAQAVNKLSPNYYLTVTIYNAFLPNGIHHHHDLTLIRAKYYDYQSQPPWQAVREIASQD